VGDVALAAGALADAMGLESSRPVIAKEIQRYHIHPFLTLPPAIAVDAVKILKGTTAGKLFVQFLPLRLRAGNPWSRSYPVGTARNVSAQTIRRYIARSEHKEKRR
jgi:putative transposase